MKALLISENIEFRRGQETKRALALGNSRPFKDGDKIKLLEPIYVYWPDGYDDIQQASKGRDAIFMSDKDLIENNMTPDSKNVFARKDNIDDVLVYNKEKKGFETLLLEKGIWVNAGWGVSPIADFLLKRPYMFKRL